MSESVIALAQKTLLDPAGLSPLQLNGLLGNLLGQGIDAADIYFQSSRHESWGLEDNIVKEAGFSCDRGVGIRAISGEKTGFAYSDDIEWTALRE